MKKALLTAGLLFCVFEFILLFWVPAWVGQWKNTSAPAPPALVFLSIVYSHASTPLGLFFFMVLFMAWVALLLFSTLARTMPVGSSADEKDKPPIRKA